MNEDKTNFLERKCGDCRESANSILPCGTGNRVRLQFEVEVKRVIGYGVDHGQHCARGSSGPGQEA